LVLAPGRPPCPPPFPYPTLFRSLQPGRPCGPAPLRRHGGPCRLTIRQGVARHPSPTRCDILPRDTTHRMWWDCDRFHRRGDDDRSEEHTSELQSRENLVCRLLLE